MDSYIEMNKIAWEETFKNKKVGWGDDNSKRIKEGNLFLNKETIELLNKINVKDKIVGQFCCNNGRDLLSIIKMGAKKGVGFDIAENIINQAKETNKELNFNCEFYSKNILEIDELFYGMFDIIFISVGSLTWFKDLSVFFNIVKKCLNDNGVIVINEIHPFVNMLLLEGEDGFDENNINKFHYSYFRKEPWIENSGISYISSKYNSSTFTSYSHTMSYIISSIIEQGMLITDFHEYERDISSNARQFENTGVPLSYILSAKKY